MSTVSLELVHCVECFFRSLDELSGGRLGEHELLEAVNTGQVGEAA